MQSETLLSAADALRQAFSSYNQRAPRAVEEKGLNTTVDRAYCNMCEQLAASLESLHPLKVCSSRRPLHLTAGMQHNLILHGTVRLDDLADAAVRHRAAPRLEPQRPSGCPPRRPAASPLPASTAC